MNNSNLIFDIGMHIGQDTEFYLKKGFKVVAIEANPVLVKKGKEKFKVEIENGQLIIIDKAISNSENAIDFFIVEDKDEWGTIVPGWNQSENLNVKKIEVQTVKLESLIEMYGTPHYMKIDIEGADVLCLKALLNIKNRPTYISVELLTPNNLRDGFEAMDIISHLKVLGYNNFQIADQTKHRLTKIPNPPLEGNFVDYNFEGSPSGLFGKELGGKWMTTDKVVLLYLNYFYKMKYIKNTKINFIMRRLLKLFSINKNSIFHAGGWFDIHAKIE